jgi:hypothetical protein
MGVISSGDPPRTQESFAMVKSRLGLCERAIDFIFRGSSIGISYEVVNLSKFINV